MKTLVIYSSKYGYAKDCSLDISRNIDCDVLDINNADLKIDTMIGEYDLIVIGSSIYMGQISKKLNRFVIDNIDLLKEKKIALFLCCGFVDKFEETLNLVFPKELVDIAIAKECFGGKLEIEKMRFFDKLISKLMKKVSEKQGIAEVKTLPENINKFIQEINKSK